MTQVNELEKKFICAIEDNTMILCEKHAKAFEIAAMTAMTPHTVYELDEEDAEDAVCHACNLQDELNRPRIIMPGEFI
jgi:hypothetical protein